MEPKPLFRNRFRSRSNMVPIRSRFIRNPKCCTTYQIQNPISIFHYRSERGFIISNPHSFHSSKLSTSCELCPLKTLPCSISCGFRAHSTCTEKDGKDKHLGQGYCYCPTFRIPPGKVSCSIITSYICPFLQGWCFLSPQALYRNFLNPKRPLSLTCERSTRHL